MHARRTADSLLAELSELEGRFADIVGRLRSRRDVHLDEMLEKKGSLEGAIRFLESQMKLAQRLKDTHAQIGKLQLKVETLNRSIRDAQGRQSARRIEADACVEKLVKAFLMRDLQREELFSVTQSVTVNFGGNLCLLDGRSSFSASSISYLKAAVHFSILFASLELPFFRYPKLVVNDNIEEKGMEEARSKNLQRIVVEFSKKATVRHQIILATSMIDPSLDNDEFCIGPSYTLDNKTLNMRVGAKAKS